MSQIKVHQRQQRAVLQKISGWGIIYTGPDNTYTMHVHIIIYTAWLVGWLPLWPPSTFSGEVEDKIVFGWGDIKTVKAGQRFHFQQRRAILEPTRMYYKCTNHRAGLSCTQTTQMITSRWKMWKVFIHHFVFRIWQRGTFKSVKYELTHSEARNINCNQCKYVRVAVLWQPPFLADCDLWMTICRQMGRSVNDMQEKISCAPHISAIYKHCTAYKRLTGWISRGNLTARCLFFLAIGSPPRYIAHLSQNIDYLPWE